MNTETVVEKPAPNFMVVDLFHKDKVENFNLAREAGVVAVMLKASEGATFHDPMYKNFVERADEAGLLIGATHYATDKPIMDQADNFMKQIGFGKVAPKVCAIDCETSRGRPPISAHDILALATAIATKTGRLPMIYGGELLKRYFGTFEHPMHDPKGILPSIAKFPLWLCQYNNHYTRPAPWSNVKLWQWTDGTNTRPENWRIKIPGISGDSFGNLDLNCFEGSADELRAFWGGASADS